MKNWKWKLCKGAVCKICQDFLSRYCSRLCFCAVMSVFCSSQEFLPLFVERSFPRPSSGWSFALHHLLLTTPQSSVAIDSPSSSDTTRPQNANASPWCHFGAMASGVGRHCALGHLDTPQFPSLLPPPPPPPGHGSPLLPAIWMGRLSQRMDWVRV